MLSSRPPACVETIYPDLKQEYHLEWPNIRTESRNKWECERKRLWYGKRERERELEMKGGGVWLY